MDVIGCWSVVGCGSSPLPRKRKTTLKCFGGSACGYVQKVPDFPKTNDSSYVAMWENFDVHVNCFGMYLGYLGEAKTNRIYLPPWRLANLWYAHRAAQNPKGIFCWAKKFPDVDVSIVFSVFSPSLMPLLQVEKENPIQMIHFLIRRIQFSSRYCWWFGNPKQPPGTYKTPLNVGINYQPQLVNAGFLIHQQYYWFLVPFRSPTPDIFGHFL